MGKGTLTICSASAGSGKTYKLAATYLASLFRSRNNYRRILAVTFTHKATAEMKFRILDNLNKLATGSDSEYLPGLIKTINKPEEWIRNEAKEIMNSILHDFSRFSVCTIDSFFQKILRAFSREIGLHSGFNIELDHTLILASAVDEMVASATSDSLLREWLINFAMSKIDDEKSWNIKDSIIKLGEELFKEKFKILSADERIKLENKKFLLEYISKIKSIRSGFEKRLLGYGKKAEVIFLDSGLSDDMFYRKGQGVPRFIRVLASGEITEPNSYVREILNDPPRWSTGAVAPQLQSAIAAGLDTILKDAIHYYYENIVDYNSADAVLSNIYALGILSDVLHNIHRITTSENMFLLSDAGELINLITKGDQAPFIYEKVGNRYENFMIDEFQDTSKIQWDNFKPLIENSMAEGFDNIIVGDVKQSIYRWRNSDWKILGKDLDKVIDNDRFLSDQLTTNWRSRSNIIQFNNTLFSIIPRQIDEALAYDTLPDSFKKLYSEAVQNDPGRRTGGFVKLEFIDNKDENDQTWEEIVLEKLPCVIETFQDKGYKASDIGIIVRDGREGACVLKRIIDYSYNCLPEKKEKYNYHTVSNDSLLLSNSPVINFIIAVISVINDPRDMISRARMLRLFLLARGDEDSDKAILISEKLIEKSRDYLPEGYEDFLDRARQMPLFEATENIIKFFGVGEFSWNVAYLNTFQDYVAGFTGIKNSDIQSFLDWWETTGVRQSVILPGDQEAMRILTIHKSKGLEFKVVILPFISWNLDHIPSKQPVLWVKPGSAPFNDLGIVPVKYGKDLSGTIFADYYKEEKYSAFLDNINLLYVALTRAKDAIYGFSVDNPRSSNTISRVLKDAITLNQIPDEGSGFIINNFFNNEKRVFELGEIPENIKEISENMAVTSTTYAVSNTMESLKLKLHGENYFSSDKAELRKKINYGKLMHEVFEGIKTTADVTSAVRKLVLEGKLPEEESVDIEARVKALLLTPVIADWFQIGNEVLTEAGILIPKASTRRPDRVIVRDGKTTIIDFKFGDENPYYTEQVDQYRTLLKEMGYENIEAFVWYVDNNKIVSA